MGGVGFKIRRIHHTSLLSLHLHCLHVCKQRLNNVESLHYDSDLVHMLITSGHQFMQKTVVHSSAERCGLKYRAHPFIVRRLVRHADLV